MTGNNKYVTFSKDNVWASRVPGTTRPATTSGIIRKGLAVVKDYSIAGAFLGYSVTHITSGKNVIRCRYFNDARRIARELGDKLDWTANEKTVLKDKAYADLVREVSQ